MLANNILGNNASKVNCVQYAGREFADYYRPGSFKILNRPIDNLEISAQPWIMLTPTMQTYEERRIRLFFSFYLTPADEAVYS